MTLFAPASRIPPPGCTVRTVEGGVEKKIEVPDPEDAMPRGVYERKPRKSKQPDEVEKLEKVIRRGRPPKHAGGGRFSEVLAQLRQERDVLDAAITALEALE